MTAHELMAIDTSLNDGAVTIDAESIAYDNEEDTVHAKGDVVITFSKGFLKADSVSMNRKTEDLLAEGHVTVVSEDDLLEGEKFTFNIKSKTGVAHKGNMFLEENHFYITGSKIMKTGAATYHITDASATTCDGDVPDWRFMSRELDVTIDGYGTMKHGRFLLRDVPVFYIPFMLFPVKTSRQSGLLFPQIGYSRDKFGLDIEIPFFWAISNQVDATFYERYIEKRGFKEGVEFRYLISEDTFGTLYGDFMNDSGPALDTAEGASRNWQSHQKRWSLYLNHETTVSPSVFFRADIRKVSDQWYFKDFSSNSYYMNNYSQNEMQRFKKVSFIGDETLDSLESTVRLVKNWSQFNITGLISDTTSFTDASNDMTLQRYPEITLKGARRPLFGTLLNIEIDAAYDYYYRATGQRGHLYDIQPVFSLPWNIGDYLQVIPQIGAKATFWGRDDSSVGDEKHDNRQLYTIGITATTEAYRIFDVGAERIEKIRHGIRPEVTYTRYHFLTTFPSFAWYVFIKSPGALKM
ncbi:hypothetical protein CC77DRAFT_1068086 [Alternaria alternata]|uniref:LptD C-terminal domain-containing protein n=1 Tax=Alternaria alternata TaxID=5599 RepID=A0A177D162_ALTAL|nr:hypothetical protein CC77DRAFT_1068086 [Alternaria alternata]OAG13201.1 hypothetical protein CC77DRAFT_1068086 [Alternaria alternata]